MKNGKPWLVVAIALVGGIMGGALATMLGAGNALAVRHVKHSSTIEAHKFVLLGHHDEERGVIRVNDKGTAALYFNDESGRERAEFRVAADGHSSVTFFDQMGRRRVLVGEGGAGDNEAGLGIFNAQGTQVAALSSTPSGEVSLTLYDPKSGLARAGLGLSSDGVPALALFDQNGKDRAELHLSPDGKPGLALADANGKSIAGLPMESGPAQ